MRTRRLSLVASTLVRAAAFLTAAHLAHAAPEVFQPKTLDEAKAAARAAGCLVIADATADWCDPCLLLDRTTWADEKVVAWVRDNAVAVQVDIDKLGGIGNSLGISTLPTIIMFKDGAECGRVIGHQTPEQLLAWFESAKRGEPQRPVPAVSPAQLDAMDMASRLKRAKALLAARQDDEATAEYLWLWANIVKREPAMVGNRTGFMPIDMGLLAERNTPARDAFRALRDDAEARLKQDPRSRADLNDWVILNQVIRDDDRTLEWFDRAKADQSNRPLIERVTFRLAPLLEDRGRWIDLGVLYDDPMKPLQLRLGLIAKEKPDTPGLSEAANKQARQARIEVFRRQIAALYGALLAADRPNDADNYAAQARKGDDSPAMLVALVRGALRAGQPRPFHLDWLTEAAQKGESTDLLLRQVRDALAAAPAK